MTAVRRLLVRGRVQGVGFRAFVARHAHRLGIDGWVRNRSDGTVEVVAAAPGALDQLEEQLRTGPRFAHVERVEREEDGSEAPGGGFHVRS